MLVSFWKAWGKNGDKKSTMSYFWRSSQWFPRTIFIWCLNDASGSKSLCIRSIFVSPHDNDQRNFHHFWSRLFGIPRPKKQSLRRISKGIQELPTLINARETKRMRWSVCIFQRSLIDSMQDAMLETLDRYRWWYKNVWLLHCMHIFIHFKILD